jgi:hypothetical protein
MAESSAANVTVVNQQPLDSMAEGPARGLEPDFEYAQNLGGGLTPHMLRHGVAETYRVLDTIDETLTSASGLRLSEIVELANLSSIVGNIVAQGIVNNSGGVFTRAGPHKYQDLRPTTETAEPIEVKISLENNKPKGHLAKAGHYLACRYVLGDEAGNYVRGERGNVVWLWEIRFGHLVRSYPHPSEFSTL